MKFFKIALVSIFVISFFAIIFGNFNFNSKKVIVKKEEVVSDVYKAKESLEDIPSTSEIIDEINRDLEEIKKSLDEILKMLKEEDKGVSNKKESKK